MYLVRVTPPMNFTFSDDTLCLKKILVGDINSLKLLVYTNSVMHHIILSFRHMPVVTVTNTSSIASGKFFR